MPLAALGILPLIAAGDHGRLLGPRRQQFSASVPLHPPNPQPSDRRADPHVLPVGASANPSLAA
jgi:hypothetical protein